MDKRKQFNWLIYLSCALSLLIVAGDRLYAEEVDLGLPEVHETIHLFSGALTLNFPMGAVPGTSGMAPRAGLVYSSKVMDKGNRDDSCGMGWRVMPESYIKSPVTDIYTLVFGGQSSPLEYDDGSGSGYPAPYGAGLGYYEEVDRLVRIGKFYDPNNNYWWVRTPDGLFYRYESDIYEDTMWPLRRVTDRFGNYMTYSYVGDRLDKIEYTYRSGSIIGQKKVVSFSYSGERLIAIEMSVNGNLQRKYVFTYTDASYGGPPPRVPDQLLASITEYGSDGDSSRPAITFSYSGGNYLTGMSNGRGRTVNWSYESYSGTGVGLPAARINNSRVASQTVSDGMGNSYSTTYAYGGLVWDSEAGEYRGHEYVKVTDPDDNYIERWFLQERATRGKCYKVEAHDSNGNLYSRIEYTWIDYYGGDGLKFLPCLTSVDSYVYDGNASCKHSKATYTNDQYGNVTEIHNMGDVDVTGDERHTYIESINDHDDWILGVLFHSVIKQSDDATIVAETWKYYSDTYNGTVDYGSSNKFLRETETAAVFGSRGNAANPTVEMSYDQWGNVLSKKNPLGVTPVTTTYDSTFHMFPVSSTNAKGHTSYTYYNGVNAGGDGGFTGSGLFGQVKSIKDINGKFVRTKYDTFGRVIACWGENFSETYPTRSYDYSYWQDSNHPNKVVSHIRKQAGAAATIDSFAYSDGMGRTIQVQSPSEESGKMMVSGPVDYNSRGLVWKKYISYEATSNGTFISSPSKMKPATFTYDAVGRLIRTDMPDGTFTRTFFDDFVTTAVDANSRQVRSKKDAYGRVVKKELFEGTYPSATVYAATSFEYDPLGRLIRTTDDAGNQTIYTYDNLGRRTAMNDPDMGTWSYSYNKLKLLTDQTDAKGQNTTFAYDDVNRLIKKTHPDGSFVQYDFDAFTGYTGTNSKGRLVREKKEAQ